jgi:MoaA/NifB/PqqE/SkfB family radical SAM enzyme
MHNWFRLLAAVYRNRRGKVPRPGWCTYLVTFRCNARCGMCDSWRMRPGGELTVPQVREIFRKVGRLDVVRLTGGEPFVRDDFAEVARAVDDTSRPAVLHITSNGSFPDRIVQFAEQFKRPRKLRFMISFDGLAAEHDANRGSDVTFAIAEETVQRLTALKDKLGLAVAANHTVISAQSLEDHFALADRLGRFGVDVQAVLAYSDSAMYGLKRFGKKSHDLIPATGYPLHPNLAGADTTGFVEKLIDRVSRLRDPLLRIGKNYYLRGLLARLRNETAPRPKPRCVALRSHLRILPDGSVPVCQFNTEKVGNLLDQSFDELWLKSPKTQESRAWVDACPGCWAECEVMPSALYTGDLVLASLPSVEKGKQPSSRDREGAVFRSAAFSPRPLGERG